MLPVLENFKIAVLPSCFHFVGSEEKVSGAKRKSVSSCLGIIYLASGISNPYLSFKSHQRENIPLAFGINSFGVNLDLHRKFTQYEHCLAGVKLSRWYFGIISSWRLLGSTQKIYITQKFPRQRVGLVLLRSCTLRRNCPAGAKFSSRRFGVISFLRQLGSMQKIYTTQKSCFRQLGICLLWAPARIVLRSENPCRFHLRDSSSLSPVPRN